MDELFDSMNGSYRNSSKKSGKLLLLPLTPQSMHNQHWVKSKTVLKTMKFISKGKVIARQLRARPSLRGDRRGGDEVPKTTAGSG
ncbi:unnamed protein product [Plutella xylostella]|uniref:(diamondback moth) hypothetical protein n=1 Tax=Plutella xylostella TaxID=51655 RepID=A0A8S4G327_PLUXY|nr:unnamed protein product [Plutella xylostella]